MSLKILIVEDEHLGIERLERHLFSIDPVIQIAGTADSVKSAVNWLKTNESPDLILMDIDLGDGQGFDIFHEVAVKSHVIFTTSYDENALQAFQFNNIDYLLKPIKKRELKECIEKYKKFRNEPPGTDKKQNVESLEIALRQQLHHKELRQRFLVKHGKKLISIELYEIGYFYAESKVSYVKMRDKRVFTIEYSLDDLEHMLDPHFYFRINSTYLAGIDCIRQVNKSGNGLLVLTLAPDKVKTAVANEKADEFIAWIEKNNSSLQKKITGI